MPAAVGHDKVGTHEGVRALGIGLLEHSEGAKPALFCDLGKPRGPSPSQYCPARMETHFPVLCGHCKVKEPVVIDTTADTLVLQLSAVKPHHFHMVANDKPCICVVLFSFSLLFPNKMLKKFIQLENLIHTKYAV